MKWKIPQPMFLRKRPIGPRLGRGLPDHFNVEKIGQPFQRSTPMGPGDYGIQSDLLGTSQSDNVTLSQSRAMRHAGFGRIEAARYL